MLSALAATLLFAAGAQDLDRDGLDDAFEQRLLTQFAPAFVFSANECDALPTEFRANEPHPVAVARNGTIYGQVSPAGGYIEVRYYHLWSRDCGRAGHALDAEHVAALVGTAGPEAEAKYWYAAAHQGTVCDRSGAARARDLGAVRNGPTIWVSRGKHGSFLARSSCGSGCGGDACTGTKAVRPAAVVNLGEPGAFLNGAGWAASPRWNLAAKMGAGFSPALLARLESHQGPGVLLANPYLRPPQAVLIGGDSGADALGVGGGSTRNALAATARKTGRGLRKALGATARAVGATGGSVSEGRPSSRPEPTSDRPAPHR